MPENGNERTEARVAVLEEKMRDVRTEVQRCRERLHELESDRATLRLLMHEVKNVSASVKELTDNVPKIAHAAAQAAVEAFYETREETGRKVMALRAQYISVGIAFGGLGVGLAALFAR